MSLNLLVDAAAVANSEREDLEESGQEIFRCSLDGCNREFSCKRNLVDHTRGHHQGAKPHICDFPGCGKSFLRPAHLLIHIRIHTGEKPFVCEYPGCGKRWNQKSALKQHLRSHTGEKPFVCTFPGCDKRFSTSSSCKRHILTHDKGADEKQRSPSNNTAYSHATHDTNSITQSPLKRKSSSLDCEGSGSELSPNSSPIFNYTNYQPLKPIFNSNNNLPFPIVHTRSASPSPSSSQSSPADSPNSSPPASPSRQLPPLFSRSLSIQEQQQQQNNDSYSAFYPTKRLAHESGPLAVIPSVVISTTNTGHSLPFSNCNREKLIDENKPKMAVNFLLN
jgi:uncharacterized Zn-finger protein